MSGHRKSEQDALFLAKDPAPNLIIMASSTTSKKHVESTATPTLSHALEPPKYYDSEPSSQPPQYAQAPGTAQRANSRTGASAASIAAILAYPSEAQLQDKKEKDNRPWRERWRDWKARHSDPELGGGVQVSGPRLNVQGVDLKSWTSINGQPSRSRW